jgi:molybdenum cofactor guanylyltransferase
MGRPKATLELGGRPLISHPLQAVAAAGLDPIVVAKPDSALPELDCEVIREPSGTRHPLSGIVAALRASEGRPVIAVACDMPFASAEMLAALAALESPLALGRVSGRLQPFPGRYDPALANHMADALERQASMRETVASARPQVLDEASLRAFGDPRWLCWSVNDQDDLDAAERELAARGGVEG